MASSIGRGLQKLYIGNLPWTIGQRELRLYFEEFGKVLSANVVFDKKSGISKRYGFVIYENRIVLANLERKTKHILEGNLLNIQRVQD